MWGEARLAITMSELYFMNNTVEGRMRTILMLAGAMLGATAAQAQAPSPIGRTFHYERTNHDGTEPEQIYFHRAAPDRLVVYKMVEKCTRSALVTATIDPATGVASSLVAARLLPDAQSAPYATLTEQDRVLVVKIDMPGMPPQFAATIGMRPWHLYDYDLATLSAAFEARAGSRADYRFGMALFWQFQDRPNEISHWIGDARARFVTTERHLDRDTLRFGVTGTAFGMAGGGPLWVDAREGYIVDVQWGRPNHDNYTDFRLRLIGEEPSGQAAWTALLTRHFEGCPPSGG